MITNGPNLIANGHMKSVLSNPVRRNLLLRPEGLWNILVEIFWVIKNVLGINTVYLGVQIGRYENTTPHLPRL